MPSTDSTRERRTRMGPSPGQAGKLASCMRPYAASIGMEVHAELLTESKMFCRCPVAFGGEPNTRTCPVCLGLPGSLPVVNRRAIELVLRTALALDCQIAMRSVFHRKNYFYPDLPKGYQISQYGETNPLGYHGHLTIPTEEGGTKTVRIRRVHLEEDTGKLTHLPLDGSGIDYNRAGVPLMEVVTDFPPDIANAEEAREYLTQLRLLLMYLGVCDGKMSEGSIRCEPNISVRPDGASEYGTKTELKNLNSFRSVQLGVEYEIKRQSERLERGERVVHETRGWNEDTESSFTMRVKEEENDYRYFADPDLVPMSFEPEAIDELRRNLPELPLARLARYQSSLGLSRYDAGLLVADLGRAAFFEDSLSLGAEPKQICNWMNGDMAKLLNEGGLSWDAPPLSPRHLVDLVRLIDSGQISGKMAKEVFADSFSSGRMPSEIVEDRGMSQITDADTVRSLVGRVIEARPDIVAKYRSGQESVAGFLVGAVIKESEGRANPSLVRELVEGALRES